MRSPIDIVKMGLLLGMNQDKARASISDHCVTALQHAHYRKTFKGVAEVKYVDMSSGSEDEEME